jgi:hypothetical protein
MANVGLFKDLKRRSEQSGRRFAFYQCGQSNTSRFNSHVLVEVILVLSRAALGGDDDKAD